MKILENIKLCNGCHACFSICPNSSITVEQDVEGFLFPKINDDICKNCGICKNICPINKSLLEQKKNNVIPRAFAVINNNEKIRMYSSSGGIFTLLAESIINEGGIVFGAKFNENWEVIHDYTETIDGLSEFRGSKYVQSRIGDAYIQVKKFLTEHKWVGRKVLFSGTPCQIGGLKSYLQKDYENLICIDIICHGVPSPNVWQKYVLFQESIAKSKTVKIAFRCKDYGWIQFSILLKFLNNTKYCQTLDKDVFMQAFLKDMCLRKSCYHCVFKTLNRFSDITISDFWGVQEVIPEMFDDKGTSLILIQSHSGQEIFDKIKHSTIFKEVDCEKSIKYNPSAFRSCIEPKKRDKFMKDINKLPFDKLVKKYINISFLETYFSLVRRLLVNFKRLLLNIGK